MLNAQAKQGSDESGKERNGEIIKAINREGEREVFYFFFPSVILLLLDWLGYLREKGTPQEYERATERDETSGVRAVLCSLAL